MLPSMFAKGTAYLARRAHLASMLGDNGADAFLLHHTRDDAGFQHPIVAASRIATASFLRLCDVIAREVYAGRPDAFMRMGRDSAEFALGPSGPYRRLYGHRSVEELAALGSEMWSRYIDGGWAQTWADGDCVHVRIGGIPPELRHRYFEESPVGWLQRALELTSTCAVRLDLLQSFSRGDEDVYYRLVLPSALRAAV